MVWDMAEVGKETISQVPTVCQALDIHPHLIKFDLTPTITTLQIFLFIETVVLINQITYPKFTQLTILGSYVSKLILNIVIKQIDQGEILHSQNKDIEVQRDELESQPNS